MDVSQAAREKVVQDLGDHFAQDRLTLDEYERRVQEAYRTPSNQALLALTSDLALPVPVAAAGTQPAVRANALAPTSKRAPKWLFALMSGVVRRGRWVVPAKIRAIACMGGVEIDLRDATLTATVTEITVLALMGGVVVTVPPGVRLESDGFAIMGGFEDQLREPASHDPDAPVVRVRGLAIMGGVETKVAEPGVDPHAET